MLKQSITYTDFNGDTQTDTLYFNLTRIDMTELLYLLPRLEIWQKKITGPNRDLTTEETLEFLDIFKILVSKSYGVRSEDGKRFRKSTELFDDFKSSAAYDELIFSMFQDVDKALEFMANLIPSGVDREESAPALRSVETAELPEGEMTATEQEIPAWVREGRQPTPKELQGMSRDEIMAAFRQKSQTPAE